MRRIRRTKLRTLSPRSRLRINAAWEIQPHGKSVTANYNGDARNQSLASELERLFIAIASRSVGWTASGRAFIRKRAEIRPKKTIQIEQDEQ